MFDVKTMDEVFDILNENFQFCGNQAEEIDIFLSNGRILAEDIISNEDIPGFDRSMVDGFAVFSSDTFGAQDSVPAQLLLTEEIKMGQKPDFVLAKGQASPIPTGGALPMGADAVVMVEYSENYNDGFIYLNKSQSPGNNVIFRGDDCKKGNKILSKYKLIRPQEIGALAAIGVSKINVFKKLKIGIISTGDEIVDISDDSFGGSKIRDVNSYALFSAINDLGCEAKRYGIIKDEFDFLYEAALKAYKECDMVLISGGSSVGERDHTHKVIEEINKQENADYVHNGIFEKNVYEGVDSPGILVSGIAVKPGKPTIIGKVCGKAIIGLPGHPVSAFMIFKTVVTPLIRKLTLQENSKEILTDAVMKSNYPSNHGREEFLPVDLETENGVIYAKPIFGKSGLITTLINAKGYVHIKRGKEGLSQNEHVKVTVFY